MLIPRTEPTNALCNIVILVVGETGAGKSYFVNKLLEVAGLQHRATIGDEVQPCTVDITHVVVPGLTSAYPALSGFQVDIVDTPGFKSSDGPASNEALFRRIETWLKENCRDAAVLGGIIYLHDISKDRLPDECQLNVASLQPFFKQGPMDKVVLVTSKWGKLYNRDFEEREKQLLTKDWAPMVAKGAYVKRFKAEETGSRPSVGRIWNSMPPTPDAKKPPAETNREVVTEDKAAAAKDIVDIILSRLAVPLNAEPSTPAPKARTFVSRAWGFAETLGLGATVIDIAAQVSPTGQVPEGANHEVDVLTVVEAPDDQVLPPKTPSMDHLPTAELQAREEAVSNEAVALAVAVAPDDREVPANTPPPTAELQAKDEDVALAVAEAPDDREVPVETPPTTAELHARDEAASNEALVLGVVSEASNGQEVSAETPPPTAELQDKGEDDGNEAVAPAVVEASDDQIIARSPSINQLRTLELQARNEAVVGSSISTSDETTAMQTSKSRPTNRPPDIVIIVMGMAKAGKSYFISKLLKEMGSEEKVEIDDSLSPCTRDLQSVAIDGLSSDNPTLKGRRLLIVDTPGFCDESSTDYNILTGIVDWLDHSREKGDALGGVIYVHDISLDDFSRPVRENLEIFERMCGEAFLKKVVLMTTKWGRAQDDRDFEAMENQLRIGFWKGMIERGARTMRLDSDDENKGGSALHIVANLLERVASPDSEASLEELMQVQREVIGHRPINLAETDAGKAMQDQLAVRRKALQGEPRNLARETNSKRGKPQSKSFTGRFFPRGRRFTGA